MAESHLKMLIRRMLRSPLGSCRSKDQISDVAESPHRRRRHYQLLELFSPQPHPFSFQQTCYFRATKPPSLSTHANCRKCPPDSPPIKSKPRNKKKGSRSRSYYGSFEEHQFPDCKYDGGAAVEDSLAVVKRSSDPYSDFRTSMVEMIVEKQIFAPNDLENLLHCFLSLNSYHHHQIIIQVFAEIWEALLL